MWTSVRRVYRRVSSEFYRQWWIHERFPSIRTRARTSATITRCIFNVVVHRVHWLRWKRRRRWSYNDTRDNSYNNAHGRGGKLITAKISGKRYLRNNGRRITVPDDQNYIIYWQINSTDLTFSPIGFKVSVKKIAFHPGSETLH